MPFIDLCGPDDRSRLDAAFGFQFRHDRLGHTIHTWLALGWCFFSSWGTTVVEVATAPLLIYAVIRVLNTWRIWMVFWTRPAILLLFGFALWELASLTWSADPAEGWNDLAKIRFGATTWALWVVMDRRPWLIAALAAGLLVGNGVQALDWAGATFGVPALDWHPAVDRHSGWWVPAVAGSLLVAALGLHIPAAVWGRGRTRWMAVGAAVITALGLLATGTRGGWLAAAGLLVVTGAIALVRAWRGIPAGGQSGETPASRGPATRATRRAGRIGLVVALLVVGVGAWATIGGSVVRRAQEGWAEVSAALRRGDYSTWTGGRIDMARLAMHAVADHPWRGIGMGGFRAWTGEQRALRGDRPGASGVPEPPYPHAHNTLLHVAATTGLPGAVLVVLTTLVLLRGAFHPDQLGPNGLGSYRAGPGFALLGLCAVSMFDTLHVNAPTCALIATLVSMCLLPPPRTPAEQGPPPERRTDSERG